MMERLSNRGRTPVMISKEDLHGVWQLESWTIGYSDRDAFTYPFGEEPQGLLLYSPAGWMSASISAAQRATRIR